MFTASYMTIVQALQRTLQQMDASRPSAYAPDVTEVAQQLRVVVAALESGAPVDRAHVKFLFAPTGAIQEASLANGWADEFLSLSKVVDAYVAAPERRS